MWRERKRERGREGEGEGEGEGGRGGRRKEPYKPSPLCMQHCLHFGVSSLSEDRKVMPTSQKPDTT